MGSGFVTSSRTVGSDWQESPRGLILARRCGCGKGGSARRVSHTACARLPRWSQSNPVRFSSRTLGEQRRLSAVFEYLESQRNFFFELTAPLTGARMGTRSTARESAPADHAGEGSRPLEPLPAHQICCSPVAVPPRRVTSRDPHEACSGGQALPRRSWISPTKVVSGMSALVDAIRRQARHEETTRWDTIGSNWTENPAPPAYSGITCWHTLAA